MGAAVPPRSVLRSLAGLLPALLALACSPSRAFRDWVAERPAPVRLAAAAERSGASIAPGVALGSVAPGPGLSAYAGDISGEPSPIRVPFDPDAPPLEVLRADLARLYPADADGATLRLDVVLERAWVHRTHHVWRASRMVGSVVLDAAVVDLATGTEVWRARVAGTGEARPVYITGEAVAEALDAAYADALAKLAAEVAAATGHRAGP